VLPHEIKHDLPKWSDLRFLTNLHIHHFRNGFLKNYGEVHGLKQLMGSLKAGFLLGTGTQ
jgi:hypothetical protein